MSAGVEKKLVRQHFDRHARNYDRYARVQHELADRLLEKIDRRAERGAILEIGCGTGYLTAQMARLFPQAGITALDFAPAMLETARQRITDNAGVAFRLADVEDLAGNELAAWGFFDLVISNATFQWFNHPEETLRKLAQVLRPGGQYLFSTFGAGTFPELRAAFEEATSESDEQWRHGPRLLPAAFWSRAVEQAGLRLMHTDVRQIRVFYPSVLELLQAVKHTGANNAATGAVVCRRPSVVRHMLEIYRRRFSVGEQIYATYEVVCVSGCKEATAHSLKSRAMPESVLPVKAGIQCFQAIGKEKKRLSAEGFGMRSR